MASGVVSFNFPKTQVFLMGAGADSCLTNLTKESTVEDLFKLYDLSAGEKSSKIKKKKNSFEIVRSNLKCECIKKQLYIKFCNWS